MNGFPPREHADQRGSELMRMKLFYVPALVLLMTNSLTSSYPATTDPPRMTTTGPSVANLKGKMLTLKGGISLYAPNFTPPSTSWPSSNETRSTARPFTASPTTQTRGVSVCLRVIYASGYHSDTLFTLSPSTSPLALRLDYLPQFYVLSHDSRGRTNIRISPAIKLWGKIPSEIWTRLCVTVDTKKNVAQMFSGFNMSAREFLAAQYVWSGEPVIDFPGFNGQVTDVQVWDYPLRYKEVFNYMTNGVYGSYSGNVLTWSSIGYAPRGKVLLEDVYEELAKQPVSTRREKERRRSKGEKTRKWDKETAEKGGTF